MHSREHRIYRVSSGKILHKQAPIRKQQQPQHTNNNKLWGTEESDTRIERIYYLNILFSTKTMRNASKQDNKAHTWEIKKSLQKMSLRYLVDKDFRSAIINRIDSKN